MINSRLVLISFLLIFSILLLGCTENTVVPPFTIGQLLSKVYESDGVTNVTYANFVAGVYDGNCLAKIGDSKLQLFDCNTGGGGSGSWNDLTDFPTGCGVGEAVQVIGTTLTCVPINVDVNGRIVYDDVNVLSIDPNNRILYGSDGVTGLINWSGTESGYLSFDQLNSDTIMSTDLILYNILDNSSRFTSIDPNTRILYASDGITKAIDWSLNNQINVLNDYPLVKVPAGELELTDNSAVTSIKLNSRTLYASDGNSVLNWENRNAFGEWKFYGNNGGEFIIGQPNGTDYDKYRILSKDVTSGYGGDVLFRLDAEEGIGFSQGNSGFAVTSTGTTFNVDSVGVIQANNSNLILKDYNNVTTLDWNNKLLNGNWLLNGAPIGSGSVDLNGYAKLNGSNQPFTGDINISKSNPKFTLTDVNSGEFYCDKDSDGNLLCTNKITVKGYTTTPTRFVGGDDYVGLPLNAVTTGNNPFSISLWLRATGTPTIGQYLFVYGDTTDGGFRLLTGDNARKLRVVINNTGTTNDWSIDTLGQASGTLQNGNWHHIIVTYDGTTSKSGTKIYYDNNLLTTAFSGTDSTLNLDQTYNRITGFVNFWDGVPDEYRLYHRELSATEVSQIYASNHSGKLSLVDTGLKAMWLNDGNTNSNWTDVTGNYSNGVLGGSPPLDTNTIVRTDDILYSPVIRNEITNTSKAYGVNTFSNKNAITTITGNNINFENDGVIKENISTTGHNFIDNYKTFWGTGNDFSAYYDGTNAYLNPREVGTGTLTVLGNMSNNGYTFTSSAWQMKSGTVLLGEFNGGSGTNPAIKLYKTAANRRANLSFNNTGTSKNWFIGSSDSDDLVTGDDFFIGTSVSNAIVKIDSVSTDVNIFDNLNVRSGNLDVNGKTLLRNDLNVNGNIYTTGKLSMRPTIVSNKIKKVGADYENVPTQVDYGATSGYSLPIYSAGSDEELYFNEYIAGRWNGASNIKLGIVGYISSAETINDDFNLCIDWQDTNTSTVLLATVNTVCKMTNIDSGREAVRNIYKVDMNIDYTLPNPDIQASDYFRARLYRTAVGGTGTEIDGEFIITQLVLTYDVDKVFKVA